MSQPIEHGRAVPPAPAGGWFPAFAHLTPPNLVTSASVALAFAGILLVASGRPDLALLCGMAAVPCDLLDGFLARRMGLQSRFGAALDSLADALSFCLLPAVAAFGVGLTAWYQLLPLFAYVLAGVWRLAQFDEAGMTQWRGRPAFQGMPTPYAASLVYLLAVVGLRFPTEPMRLGLTAAVLVLAIAMVARLPFPKGGWHYRVMWILLPLGAVFACR